jgi:ubiquinone/menaquinone biosynthesis C-methylase UbiE
LREFRRNGKWRLAGRRVTGFSILRIDVHNALADIKICVYLATGNAEKSGLMENLLAALRAVAEPTRLRLVVLCARGELTVSELTQILGQSQPRVSRHLKLLCAAGLLDRFREGSWVFYRLRQSSPVGALARQLVAACSDADPTIALDLQRLSAIKRQRADVASAYFRENAAQWHRIRSLYVDECEVEAALVEIIAAADPRDLLDIGTGTGRMLEILAPRVERALGIDQSREMLAVARVNLERAGLENGQVRLGDMYQLALPDASFDAVVIHQVLHYADRPAAVIAEAARMLRPSGILMLVDFAPHSLEFLRDEHAHRRLGFADSEVAEWCAAAGLELAPPRWLPGDPLTVVIWTAQRSAATRPRMAGEIRAGIPDAVFERELR